MKRATGQLEETSDKEEDKEHNILSQTRIILPLSKFGLPKIKMSIIIGL